MSDQLADRDEIDAARVQSPTDREALEFEVRSRLAGHDMLAELLADRRRDAQTDSGEPDRTAQP